MRTCSRILTERVSISVGSFKSFSFHAVGSRWSSTSSRQWSTPLAKNLAEAIATAGPISVASYMRQCLTSPDGGYYTRHMDGRDQFGKEGDFITGPEISQIFGELVGIWVLAEWMAQGKKSSGVQIIEVGPGRGTLLDDMLRVIHNNKQMTPSIEAIYMVEASPSLRNAQKKLLCGDASLVQTDIGWESVCKYLNGVKVVWCEDIKFVPKSQDNAPFIVAHEFFDALPIHIFQSVASQAPSSTITVSSTSPPVPAPSASNQWRELVVIPTPANSTHTTLNTPVPQRSSSPDPPEFQLTLAKSPTPHSLFLPSTSDRYKALKPQTGSVIEISPESLIYASDFAVRIGGANPAPPSSPSSNATSPKTFPFQKPVPSGAALIIDYGPSGTIPSNSLRGIRSHRVVSPFSSPGLVDLSADVDFLALAHAALDASPNVEVHSAIEQSQFLRGMGIEARARMLLDGVKEEGEKGREKRERIEGSVRRLLDRGPMGMGKIYKVMAITPHVPSPEDRKRRRPVGFGGDVD